MQYVNAQRRNHVASENVVFRIDTGIQANPHSESVAQHMVAAS